MGEEGVGVGRRLVDADWLGGLGLEPLKPMQRGLRLLPLWKGGLREILSALGLKNDINRSRIRKLYQSTNMVQGELQDLGFDYRYDLHAGLAEWKQVSRLRDFD